VDLSRGEGLWPCEGPVSVVEKEGKEKSSERGFAVPFLPQTDDGEGKRGKGQSVIILLTLPKGWLSGPRSLRETIYIVKGGR